MAEVRDERKLPRPDRSHVSFTTDTPGLREINVSPISLASSGKGNSRLDGRHHSGHPMLWNPRIRNIDTFPTFNDSNVDGYRGRGRRHNNEKAEASAPRCRRSCAIDLKQVGQLAGSMPPCKAGRTGKATATSPYRDALGMSTESRREGERRASHSHLSIPHGRTGWTNANATDTPQTDVIPGCQTSIRHPHMPPLPPLQ